MSVTPLSACAWVAHTGFGFNICDWRPIQTRFPYGSRYNFFNLPHIIKSLVPSPKGTWSSRRTPTLWKHKVSGSISLPSRGSFHLSFTVLVHYRSRILFSLGEWSPQIHTGFLVSDATYEVFAMYYRRFQIRDYNPLWSSFPECFSVAIINCLCYAITVKNSCNSHMATVAPLAPYEFRLFPFRSSLLRESQLISFPCLLRYFSSAGVLPVSDFLL